MLLLQPPSGEVGDGSTNSSSGGGGGVNEPRASTAPLSALSGATIKAPVGDVLGFGGKGDAGRRGADSLGAAVADAGKKVLQVEEGKRLKCVHDIRIHRHSFYTMRLTFVHQCLTFFAPETAACLSFVSLAADDTDVFSIVVFGIQRVSLKRCL